MLATVFTSHRAHVKLPQASDGAPTPLLQDMLSHFGRFEQCAGAFVLHGSASSMADAGSDNCIMVKRLRDCRISCVLTFRHLWPCGNMRAGLRHELSLRRADYDMQVIYMEVDRLACSGTLQQSFLEFVCCWLISQVVASERHIPRAGRIW